MILLYIINYFVCNSLALNKHFPKALQYWPSIKYCHLGVSECFIFITDWTMLSGLFFWLHYELKKIQAVALVCLSLGADCSTGTDGIGIQNLWSVCTLLQSSLTTGNATSTFVAIFDSIEPSCCQSHQGVDWYQKHGSNEAAFCMAMCVFAFTEGSGGGKWSLSSSQ